MGGLMAANIRSSFLNIRIVITDAKLRMQVGAALFMVEPSLWSIRQLKRAIGYWCS